MDVRIAQPLGYSELGSRNNNEDRLYPDPQTVSKEQKWFIVCDGVGGMERGEVASSLAATSLDAYLRHYPIAVATDEFIQQAVAYVETQFNQYLSDHQEATGMATTLTLVYFHEAGATIAHIGDSRIYHIRNGQVIWRTDDHSYVNELLKAGVLSPGEAHNHPQRNIITRAVQGGDKPVEASVQLINHLRPGDYFFLCTDGILERISDELLANTLYPTNQSNEQKVSTLRQYSLGNTRDNFTAYLIQVEHVSGTIEPTYQVPPPAFEQRDEKSEVDDSVTLINITVPQSTTPHPTDSSSPSTSLHQPQERQPTADRQSNHRTVITPWLIPTLALAGALVGAGGYALWQQQHSGGSKKNEPVKAVTQRVLTTQTASLSVALPAESSIDTEFIDLTVPAVTPVKQQEIASSGNPESDERETKKNSNRGTPAVLVENKVDPRLSVVRDTKTNKLGLQEANGKLISELIYTSIGRFKNGVATAKVNEKIGYLNRDGRWFDEMRELQEGKIPVRRGNRWGYLNTQGQVSIALGYDRVAPFQANGTADVVRNGKPMRIDKRGQVKSDND